MTTAKKNQQSQAAAAESTTVTTKSGCTISESGIVHLTRPVKAKWAPLYARARAGMFAAKWSDTKRREAIKDARIAFAHGNEEPMEKLASMPTAAAEARAERKADRKAKGTHKAGKDAAAVKAAQEIAAAAKPAPKGPKGKAAVAVEHEDKKALAAVKPEHKPEPVKASPKAAAEPLSSEAEARMVGEFLAAHPAAKVSDLLRHVRGQLSTKRAMQYLDAWKKANSGKIEAPAAAAGKHVRSR